ncbi:MAG: hypothetical protein HZB99_02540 [Candidatus Harrisonbacteria bacterium]|nr:hypothetical protein [Candidatus Harrisonbacteria bacterium]
MLRGKASGSANHQVVRAIQGKNFFGVEEWTALYSVKFTKKQLREVAEFPWGEDVLNAPCPLVKGKTVKETHFAFLGLENVNGKPLTILHLQELHPQNGQPKFASYAPSSWYSQQTWATKLTAKFRWYLMPLEIVPNSESKTYQDQVAMLPQGYEVPTAVEEVLKDILYYRKNGIYLNPTRYARTTDVTSDGYRVVVGFFDGDGLFVFRGWDDGRGGSLGLGASRKF